MTGYIHACESEWLKRKRSLASWLVIVGGFFTPAIIIIVRLVKPENLPKSYADPNFWNVHWRSSWESMAIFLLPWGIILSTSLINQLEFKNNAWKQVHTLPVSFTTVFFSKFTVVMMMLVQFFLLFNVGIYLSAMIPYWLRSDVPFPAGPIPYAHFLRENALAFISCLPMVGLQFLVSLKFRNFLVAIGAGLILWLTALSALPWKYNYLIPYAYTALNYVKDATQSRAAQPPVNIYWFAAGYFILFTIVNYILYLTRRDKG